MQFLQPSAISRSAVNAEIPPYGFCYSQRTIDIRSAALVSDGSPGIAMKTALARAVSHIIRQRLE
jgi:hypothetical protein